MLLPHHRESLYESGLTDETIRRAGVYSEVDPLAIAKLLRWSGGAGKLGSCLVIPYPSPSGGFNGYARVRPDRPRPTGGKYESPRALSSRAYIPSLAAEAIRNPTASIGITEGEKKAIAAEQIGLPCIGLAGVWMWQKKRERNAEGVAVGDREFLDELAAVDWRGRAVWICFDTDPRRNPDVNQSLAELWRVLALNGANVHVIRLPTGPPDSKGIPTKHALDDYLVRLGGQSLADLVRDQMKPPILRSVDSYRQELGRNREDSVGRWGVYLDQSPTGAGKSYADRRAAKKARSSLTVEPTHKNCEQTEADYVGSGLDAAAYPQLSKMTCQNFVAAERAMKHGLSVTGAVCVECKFRDSCVYKDDFERAEAAKHRIATHQRASLTFKSLATRRRYITVHEDAVDLLRPQIDAFSGFAEIVGLAEKSRPRMNPSEEYYFTRLELTADKLFSVLETAEKTETIQLPVTPAVLRNVDLSLIRAMQQTGIWPNGDAMRILKSLLACELAELVVRVDKRSVKGKEVKRKRISAIRQTMLPDDATIWFSDATADPDELEEAAGRPIQNRTPEGILKHEHPVVQIVSPEIRKGTQPNTVIGVMRSLLLSLYRYRRIGVICHKTHVSTIRGTARGPRLDESLRALISEVEYFRSGDSRGSNKWHELCEVLIVLGTPRVPPEAIRSRLVQQGKTAAAARDAEWTSWGRDYWSAKTTSGGRRTVRTRGYRDHDWHSAHRSIVTAELKQAIGRGRSIMANGIPVVVISAEDLDVPVWEGDLSPLSDRQLAALEAVWELSQQSITEGPSTGLQQDSVRPGLTEGLSNIYIQGPSVIPRQSPVEQPSVRASDVATRLKISDRAARELLSRLADSGWVSRVGERKGWVPGPGPLVEILPPPSHWEETA